VDRRIAANLIEEQPGIRHRDNPRTHFAEQLRSAADGTPIAPTRRMSSSRARLSWLRRLYVASALCLAVTVSGIAAGDRTELIRVRATSARLQAVLADGIAGSETLRELIDTLQRSDVIVFIAPQVPAKELIWGELHFAASAPGVRYLRVNVKQELSRMQLLEVVAHELQHAAEVAAASHVVSTKTMEALYDRIGFEIVRGQHETDAARAIGDRVRHEVLEYEEALQAAQRKH